jgi:hypothetical protein
MNVLQDNGTAYAHDLMPLQRQPLLPLDVVFWHDSAACRPPRQSDVPKKPASPQYKARSAPGDGTQTPTGGPLEDNQGRSQNPHGDGSVQPNMKVTTISRGFVEVTDGGRQFRVYGEGLVPKGDGVEYVIYANSAVEMGIASGVGPFRDEQAAEEKIKVAVVEFLKTWAFQQGRKWDFE